MKTKLRSVPAPVLDHRTLTDLKERCAVLRTLADRLEAGEDISYLVVVKEPDHTLIHQKWATQINAVYMAHRLMKRVLEEENW
jgi:hypothetical protein